MLFHKDTVVKQNLIRTIDLIGKALHPDHLKIEGFVFSKRGDLINHLLVRVDGCAVMVEDGTDIVRATFDRNRLLLQ